MDALGSVVRAYWDLVGAIENVRVREESLANAERLLETNQRRLDIGTAATIDVLQTKAEVANRQGDLVSARSQAGDAEDALKRLMSMIDDDRLASVRVMPTDRPSMDTLDIATIEDFDVRVEQSITRALEYRPEVKNAELEIDSAAIEAARTKNLMLPRLDLTGSLSLGGRGKTSADPFRGFSNEEDKLYSWGVQLSVPLGNRTARHTYTRALLTKEQSEQRLQKVLEDLMYNVRLASRQVLTSQILVATNEQTRILQEANVAAEEKKLELGVTTSYRVLDVQEDLTIAQVQEVQAHINYQKSLVELELAEGLFLEDWGVQVEIPEYISAEPFIESIIPFVDRPSNLRPGYTAP
jgi:outer membrane protein TolC